MAKESPDPYYQQLVGKVFEGTYTRDWSRPNDKTARLWKVVEINHQTEEMRAGLDNIVQTFGERIWKGMVKDKYSGIWELYVNPDSTEQHLFDSSTKSKKKYKINMYDKFDIEPETSKTGTKYSDECGCYFILVAAY